MKNKAQVMMTLIVVILAIPMIIVLPWIMIASAPIALAFVLGPLAMYAVKKGQEHSRLHAGSVPKRVLLVDDDDVVLAYLEKVFDSIGVESVVFNNPLNALSSVNGRSFDFIIADQMMPELSGEDFVRRLDSQMELEGTKARPGVLLFTGHPEDVHLNESQLTHLNYRGVLPKKGVVVSNLVEIFNKGLVA